MRTRLTPAVLIVVLALFGAGCGDDPETPSDPEAPGDDFDYSRQFDPAPANIAEDGVTPSYDCADKEVTIDASDVVVFLWGTCQSVTINGDDASVSIGTVTDVIVNGDYANVSINDDVANITINGNSSEVRYSGEPSVTINGDRSNAFPH